MGLGDELLVLLELEIGQLAPLDNQLGGLSLVAGVLFEESPEGLGLDPEGLFELLHYLKEEIRRALIGGPAQIYSYITESDNILL